MKILILLVCLLIIKVSNAQDTISVEICYSYDSCKTKSNSIIDIYNSKCLIEECGWVVEQWGGLLFLREDKKIFSKPIKIWWWKKIY